MRCPSCSGFNRDDAIFCKICGRSLPSVSASQQSRQQPQRPPHQPPSNARPPQPPPSRPVYPPYQPPQSPPYRQPVVAPKSPPGPQAPQAPPSTRVTRPPISNAPPPTPALPAIPDAPAPFPPRTMEQLRSLEQGALPYTLLDKSIVNGRKQVIRIFYQKCAAWQQVATLYKALKEYQEAKYETVVIQGVSARDDNAYNFTNGQLSFDRDVRLGSQILKRYQVETNNGYDADSMRIVLVE